MTQLYLRYKQNPLDPWILPPALPASVPSTPSGAVPLSTLWLATEPEQITACGCPTAVPYIEDHFAAHVSTIGLSHSDAKALQLYLLQYKLATSHEANLDGFTLSAFRSAELTNLEVKSNKGSDFLSFRLAATISDAITP